MTQIPASQLNCDLLKRRVHLIIDFHKRYACIADDDSAEDVLSQASLAAEHASQQLSTIRPSFKLTTAAIRKDGTTTLKLLAAEHLLPSLQNEPQRVFRLSDLIPKLREGTPGLPKPEVKSGDAVALHSSLDYGSYASFAPLFDSTWSTLGREESTLLSNAFANDQNSVEYFESVRRFSLGFSDDSIERVDGILDALTNGEYTKVLKAEKQFPISTIANSEEATEKLDQSKLQKNPSVSNSSQLRSILAQSSDSNCRSVEQVLDQNSTLLSHLQRIQNERLSRQPPFSLSEVKSCDNQESKVAHECVFNLAALAAQTQPGSLVSAETVRKSMVIRTTADNAGPEDNEEYDMEVFKEFFQV